MTRPFVFEMETSDPDDLLTLILLLGHPMVDLRAVVVSPGSREQVGVVRQVLAMFKRADVAVGSHRLDHPKGCVSAWHYGNGLGIRPQEADADPGVDVLASVLGPDTTYVCGAPPKNLGELLARGGDALLGRAFVQGGFAGEGVVPYEQQLPKFKGKVTVPSFNLNGAPKTVQAILDQRARFSDLRFVSKNVCHGVVYDQVLHTMLGSLRQTWCGHTAHSRCTCPCHAPGARVMHVMPCCSRCPICGDEVTTPHKVPKDRTAFSQMLLYLAMGAYLSRHPQGKALHDPLAACCAIDPDVGEWAEVELFHDKGNWGSRLSEASGVRIITGCDLSRFIDVLIP